MEHGTPDLPYTLAICRSVIKRKYSLQQTTLHIQNNIFTLISNEHDFKRAKVLLSNLERLGLSAMITSLSCDDLAKEFKDQADYVLLDAPCSGEGMIRKDPSILKNYSLNNINKLSKLQSELLDKALDLLKDGGYLVYSTCTYAIEENEMNVLEFLKRHEGVTLLDTTIDHCHRGLKYKDLESAKLLRFSPALVDCYHRWGISPRPESAVILTLFRRLRIPRA